MLVVYIVLLALALFVLGAFLGRPGWGGIAGTVAALALWAWQASAGLSPAWYILALLSTALILVFGLPPLRRRLFASTLLPVMARVLPRLGDTERVALEAGTVWWDAELFSGRPHWRRLLNFNCQPLSPSEQEFLRGPVEQLCQMLDDWQIQQDRDLSPEVWAFLREHRFFGMIIPSEFGGLGFSEIGHARVVTRIASRSATAAVTVMVPNSLGPAELLLHYGTDEQKNYYLPRLAEGREIPCFALTGPEAGSDAAATQSEGIVEARDIDGQEVLGLRLNWCKRYITLAPVATLIGLAFRMKDPHRLLGDQEDLGITCALIPRQTPGVEIGQRHDPMGVPFQNGPTEGHEVWVPLEAIIGGREGIGRGWRMLMESLAAGRSISLPALSVGAAEMATRICGAYATVREQFDTPIGRFEGIEEPLARIAGKTYLMRAAQTLTCGALDAGERPGVLGSIIKVYLTELMREVLADAMDIRAGAAIQRGPRNVLAHAWMAAPIAITVEGANILTRSMIIYGQGAIRCHPFVQQLISSTHNKDYAAFDHALFGYAGFVIGNALRTPLLALSGGRLAYAPRGPRHRAMQAASRYAVAFSLLSDLAMASLGSTLKRREMLSGRFADALGWLYLASATIKRAQDEADDACHRNLSRYACELALYRVEQALGGILDNLPVRPVAWLATALIFPLGRRRRSPRDTLTQSVARSMLEDRDARRWLTEEVFVPPPHEPGLGTLEAALDRAMAVLPIETKLRDAVREGRLPHAPGPMLDDLALSAGVISEDEYERLGQAREARREVIQVDTFDTDTFRELR